MKVNLGTIEVDDVQRRAIRHRYGKTGLATREEVRHEYISLVQGDMQEIVSDLLSDRPYWWDRQ
tara:strand:- start:85 stop:276 length:192 start_codon:yes stop_codon:yes gene_type:complete